MKSRIKSLATPTPKNPKPSPKAAYFLSVKTLAEMDKTETF